MTIRDAAQQLLSQLITIYDKSEAANIADLVMEHVIGQRKIDRLIAKEMVVTSEQELELKRIGEELLQHKPVQYVLGHAWFMGMKLAVNESVLIPRPETEELVEWLLNDVIETGNRDVSILDIGTGSGCIPIALKSKMLHAEVSAIDISDNALQIARLNSISQNVLIDFLHLDFLDEQQWQQLSRYDIIVSNPPYIRRSEQLAMSDNVLKHEPHVALFVADEEPLLFYKAIAKFSSRHLKEGGRVYVEINEAMGGRVVELFKQQGFGNAVLRQDMQGRDRMVKADTYQ